MNRIIFDPGHEIQQVVLVGLGGTGSQLARSVCRIAYDRIQKQQSSFKITFVDPDVVEIQNVGRQMFTPADVGQYKAELLATRFSRALGIEVGFFNDEFNADYQLKKNSTPYYRRRTLLIGCVDNYMARRSLSEAKCLILDCGNHYDSGQVILGNSSWKYVRSQWDTPENDPDLPVAAEWAHLPYPYLIYPELLDKPEDEDVSPTGDNLSCAELIERDTQHLLINEYVALAAAQYVYKLLHRQPVTSYMTHVDSDLMTMHPKPISVEAMQYHMPAETPAGEVMTS